MDRVDIEVSGGCQCGAVRYHATQMLDNSHLCHCRMCQKAVGGIFAALVAAPDEKLVWTRGEPAVWRSSEHVERGFCANCGTPLFYRDVNNGRTNLTIGSLDNPGDFPPHANSGTENMVGWFQTIPTIEDDGATEADREDWAAAIKASNNQHPDRDTESWNAKPRQ
ncbi:GFA family protein [Pelagibacterium limicola]|uniref:GFA family protein n=1 Tax=Pelagibacterium limicola TaxID=2791022 RepID=UPI0018AF7C87|nr:GFA family protein [Pelagibacterium limicola]